MAEIRHALATWTGSLVEGSGTIDYVSSGAFSRMPVTWASRTQAHNGKTSPEELLAAAHAACFSMAFASRLAKNGTPAGRLTVRAEVTLDNPTGGGWKVAASRINVRGTAPGVDGETFARLADDAKDNCPISAALRGNVELSVEAALLEG
jgi:osmotically inducible protein OsmC